jgi:sulfite exporter TauE/SafE
MISAVLGPLAMGLAGSGHCGAMCGGIAGGITSSARAKWPTSVSLHGGRLLSYAAAGAVVGEFGALVGSIDRVREVLEPMRAVAGALLVALGVSLALGGRSFAWLDRIGGPLWRIVGPHAQRLSRPQTPFAALAFGTLWGLLPCGLVYGAVALAAVSGSPVRGAGTMLAFGMGTLPALLVIGSTASRVRLTVSRLPRIAAGLLIAASGLMNFAVGWPPLWGGSALSTSAVPACCHAHVAR